MADLFLPLSRWQGGRTIGRLPEPEVVDRYGRVEPSGEPAARGPEPFTGSHDPRANTTHDPRARRGETLVVLGDELAAADRFAENIAHHLADARGVPVVFQSVAESMATIRELHFGSLNRVPAATDALVLAVGAHDVLARTGLDEWRSELTSTLSILTRVPRVVVAGVPDPGAAPLVGWPLSKSLSGRAAALDEVTGQVCAEAGRPFVPLPAPTGYADDRWTPDAASRAAWAQRLAAAL